MSIQPSAIINQPFDVFKSLNSHNIILHNNNLYIRSNYDDFKLITNQVSHLFVTNAIYIIRNNILYQFISSLIEIQPINQIPNLVFASKFGLVFVFSSSTTFHNQTIPSSISNVIEFPNHVLLYNENVLYIHQTTQVLSKIEVPNILHCTVFNNNIIIVANNGIRYYKDLNKIKSISFAIDSVIYSLNDTYIVQHKQQIYHINLVSSSTSPIIELPTVPKSVAYNNNVLCIINQNNISLHYLADFQSSGVTLLQYQMDRVVPYMDGFIAMSSFLLFLRPSLFLTVCCGNISNLVVQTGLTSILYNNTTFKTGLILDVIFNKYLFVICADFISIYSISKQELQLKYTIPYSPYYSIDAPLLYINNDKLGSIDVYDVSKSINTPIKSLSLKYQFFDMRDSLMVAVNDQWQLSLFINEVCQYKMKLDVQPCFVKISNNGQYVAVYTKELIIINTTTFEDYKFETINKHFHWDNGGNTPCFIMNHQLYLVTNNKIYKIALLPNAVQLHLPYYTTDTADIKAIDIVQHDLECLSVNIMDIYELQSLSKNGYKTALILYILLKEDDQNNASDKCLTLKQYCQLELEMSGTDEQMLMQLNVDPIVWMLDKKQINILSLPGADATIIELVTFYNQCPTNLYHSVLDYDYEVLAPLIHKSEVYKIIGDYKYSLHQYASALEYYKLAQLNAYHIQLKMDSTAKPIEQSDYYHLADQGTLDTMDKVKYYIKSGCLYHALHHIRANIKTLDSQFMIKTLQSMSMDKEGMKQIGLVLELIDEQVANVYYDKMFKTTVNKSNSLEEDVLVLLNEKSYKQALKLVITNNIKITNEMHTKLLQSDLELGEIYKKMGYLDYAMAYFLQNKKYESLLDCMALKLDSYIDKGDYKAVLQCLEKKIKIMNKLVIIGII